MKRIQLTLIALIMGFSATAAAQDGAPVMYIPGMPVPQAPAAAPAATSDAPAANKQDAGKISRISKAGDSKTQAAAVPADIVVGNDGLADYKGVTPTKRLVPENAQTFQHTTENQMSWIGFMPEEGQHRIFLQTSSPTAYQQISTASDRIEILLLGTKLAVHNNQRELDMSFFKTPFRTAKASPAGKDVRVVIQLKEAVPYEIKTHDNLLEIFVKPNAQ